MSDEEIAFEGIKAEIEAILLYEKLLRQTNDEVLKNAIEDIIEEEKIHIGEFLSAVLKNRHLFNKGLEEVCNMARKLGIEHEACTVRLK